MATIMDLPSGWRQSFQPASFKGATFWYEVNNYEGGHRLVIHEFPKKDKCYTESMGKRYFAFSVRAYVIQNVRPGPGSARDYRQPRDRLLQVLEQGGKGTLILPFHQEPKEVMCRSWRVTEEDRLGGYAVFDLQFVEASALPFKPQAAPRELLAMRADELRERVLVRLAGNP